MEGITRKNKSPLHTGSAQESPTMAVRAEFERFLREGTEGRRQPKETTGHQESGHEGDTLSLGDDTIIEELREQENRIDREELEMCLRQWYDQVTFDEEHDQIFLQRKNGLMFPVQYDEVDRLIKLNDERDRLDEKESRNVAQKETSILTDVTSLSAKLNEGAARRREFIKKALESNGVYTSVAVLDTGDFELTDAHGVREILKEEDVLKKIGTPSDNFSKPTYGESESQDAVVPEHVEVGISKDELSESEIVGSHIDELYTSATGITFKPGEKVSKQKLTSEEQRAYLASVKEKRNADTPITKKPHLNNAESIAYLKQVEKRRIEESVPQESVVKDAYWSAFEGQVGEKFKNPVLDTKVDVTLPTSDEEVKSTAEDLQRERKADIAELERAKSEVSYGSEKFRAFIEKHDKEFANELRTLGGGRDAATYMWIERKLAELKSKEKQIKGSTEGFFEDRFEKEFGIGVNDLESLPGYKNLDAGKRTLLLENLQAYADQGDGRLKSFWNGFLAQAGVKQEGPPPKGTKGFQAYKKQLQLFVHAMEGVSVHLENGKAMPDFTGIRFDREHRSAQKEVVDALNASAHAFSNIPGSWQEDGAGVHDAHESKLVRFFKELPGIGSKKRKQFRAYQEKLDAYNSAKKVFAERMIETGVSEEAVVRALLNVDHNVHLSRFIETNPDAVAELEEGVDEKTASTVGKYVGMGGYIALGAITKRFAGGILEFAGGPLAAGIIAGTKEWNKKAALQRENDRQRMLGHPDDAAEYNRLVVRMKRAHSINSQGKEYKDATDALRQYEERSSGLNMISARTEVKVGGEKIDRGIIAKLHYAVREYERYRTSDETYTRTNEYGETIHLKKSDRAFENLLARIQYADDKFNLNRIQFGSGAEYALNKAAFREALTEAKVIANLRSMDTLQSERGTRLRKRLDEKLRNKESLIAAARRTERRKETYNRETWKAAGFAAIGVGLQHSGLIDMVGEKIGNTDWYTNTSKFFKDSYNTPLFSSMGETERGDQLKGGEGDGWQGILTEGNKPPAPSSGDPYASLAETGGVPTDDTQVRDRESKEGSGGTDPVLSQSAVQQREVSYSEDSEPAETHRQEQPSADRAYSSDAEPNEVHVRNEILERVEDTPKVSVVNVEEPTPKDKIRASILTENYLRGNIPLQTWDAIKHTNINVFIADTQEAGAQRRLGNELAELGKVLNLVTKAPYNIELKRTDTLESFLRKAFIGITQADLAGANTDPIRHFIATTKLVPGKLVGPVERV